MTDKMQPKAIAIFNENIWQSRPHQRVVQGMPSYEAINELARLGIKSGCASQGNNGNALIVAVYNRGDIPEITKSLAQAGINGATIVDRERLNNLAPIAMDIEGRAPNAIGCR